VRTSGAERAAVQPPPEKTAEGSRERGAGPATPPAPVAPPSLQSDPRQTQEERERARRLEQTRVAAEREMEEVRRALRELERLRVAGRATEELVALTTQLDASKKELARTRRLVEIGLASPMALDRLERDIATLDQRLVAMKVEHELDARQSDLRTIEAEKQREIERLLLEKLVQQDRDATDQRLLDNQELYERMRRAVEEVRAVAGTVTTEPAQAGDVVLINIASEPDVPRAYTVAADGTIRLPLSPPLRVDGLTAGEIQIAIVKQLTARGLSNVAVEVEVRRPRQ
jgi:hypothetical protein